jgi:hypothetical protein
MGLLDVLNGLQKGRSGGGGGMSPIMMALLDCSPRRRSRGAAVWPQVGGE